MLNKCGKDGCDPIEQVRGQMKPADHFEQYRRHIAAEQFSAEHGVALPLQEFRAHAFDVEDLGAEHNSDIRIACRKCGKATGWDRIDIEEFKRHGDGDYRRHMVTRDGNKDNIRNRWNDGVK